MVTFYIRSSHFFVDIKGIIYEMYLNLFMNILSIKSIIPLFEKLSFKEKIDLLAEIFLILEHDELLPDNVDGYEIARMIIKN